MTITIDPDNVPAELFTVSVARLRAGKGPLRVVPTGEVLRANSLPWALYGRPEGKGAAHIYTAAALFLTLDEAKAEGARLVERERTWARQQFDTLSARLGAAAAACRK